jgi:DNA polymerase-3 subunit epsilon
MTPMNNLPEWLNRPLQELPYIVLDTETTGLTPPGDRVVEIAIIHFENGREEAFETLINPEMPIPAQASAVHHITDAMVADKPTIREIAAIVSNILAGGIFVSHNVPFDWAFVDHLCRPHLQKPLRMPSLCTLHLSRKYLPLRSRALGAVAQHLNIDLREAHRAMADTRAVKEVLRHFIASLPERGLKTGADLHRAGLLYLEIPPTR